MPELWAVGVSPLVHQILQKRVNLLSDLALASSDRGLSCFDHQVKTRNSLTSFACQEEPGGRFRNLIRTDKSEQISASEKQVADQIVRLTVCHPIVDHLNQIGIKVFANFQLAELFLLKDYVIFFSFGRLAKLFAIGSSCVSFPQILFGLRGV